VVPIPKMNKKTVTLLAVVLAGGGLAGALALGGDSIGGTFGSIGRSVIDGAIGRFAYPNRSSHSGNATARNAAQIPGDAVRAAQNASALATAHARQADAVTAGATDDGAAAMSAAATADPSAPQADMASAQNATESGPIGPAGPVSEPASAEASAASPSGESDGTDPDAAALIASRRSLSSQAAIDAAGGDDEPLADEMSDATDDESWDTDEDFLFDDEKADGALREEGPTYSTLGKRDPFYALVTAKEQNAKSSEMVDPDRVQLVGIMWGESGICAIVEDGRGRGYVLREGDRILYGRVVSITRNSILVHQMIHGEFKSVELHLESQVEED